MSIERNDDLLVNAGDTAKDPAAKSGRWVSVLVIYACTLLTVLISGYLLSTSAWEILRDMLSIFVVDTVFILILTYKEEHLFAYVWKQGCFLVPLAAACLHILAGMQMELYHVWMVGSLLIAVLVEIRVGVWSHLVLTVLYCLLRGSVTPQFVFYFALGAVLCLACGGMEKIGQMLQVLVIGLCMNVVLLLAFCEFDFHLFLEWDTLYSMISVVYCVGISYIIRRLLANRLKTPSPEEDAAFIEEILDSGFPLLQELQGFSKNLYMHSVDVSELSYMAAKEIGADALVAKAAGMYHEIGRIFGKDYIAQGVTMAQENHFPEPVIQGIRQHNVKYEMPSSAEAAIVMLSDSVVSTIEYLESVNKVGSLTPEEIVDNVFTNRFEKGALDESGLTLGDYHRLRVFYSENAF